MYCFLFIIKSTPFRELFINLWLPSGKIVNFIHGKNEFWQKLDFRGIVPCRACDQVMTIPSFKGQAHDMFSRIFQIRIYDFFLFTKPGTTSPMSPTKHSRCRQFIKHEKCGHLMVNGFIIK